MDWKRMKDLDMVTITALIIVVGVITVAGISIVRIKNNTAMLRQSRIDNPVCMVDKKYSRANAFQTIYAVGLDCDNEYIIIPESMWIEIHVGDFFNRTNLEKVR